VMAFWSKSLLHTEGKKNKNLKFYVNSAVNLCFFLLCFLVCKNLRADIVFLVDSSGSIHPAEFQRVKKFTQSVVSGVEVGLDAVRFGLLQFSSDVREEFQLDRYSSTPALHRAIQEMQQMKGGTLTGKALSFAASYFDRDRGGRPELKQYLIVITDGESQEPVKMPAKAIRDKGIIVYAIDMLRANNSQLVEIAGTQDRVFLENNLEFLNKKILFEICSQENYLVFLIDGSESISENNFSIMKNFMKEIVDSFIVSKDDVHVGVVQYSQDPQKEFSLKDFYTSTSIKDQIDSIVQLRSSTYTGKGLRFVRSLFEPANGSRIRQGVSQNLIVITDGYSADEVDDAAMALRREGILLFAVGVGTINSFELLRIAGDAKRVFTECTVLQIKLHASDFLAKVQQ
uniref:VWFA domain-containing protein n=1 Tax=Nothoprocta perdicaria TaxID=30464 RepID=A0A8C6ZIE1_NOTPE